MNLWMELFEALVTMQCGMKIVMMMMIGNFRGDITEYIAVAREMGRWREE